MSASSFVVGRVLDWSARVRGRVRVRAGGDRVRVRGRVRVLDWRASSNLHVVVPAPVSHRTVEH